MAMLADECEPASDSGVDLSVIFSYLAIALPLGTVEIGRFLCLEIVVSRDVSAVKPDWVVAKPDEVELFAGKPGAKSIPMKALPGESCRLLGGDCRVPGRYCRFLGMRLTRAAGVALTGQVVAAVSEGKARATSLRRTSDPGVRSWWGLP